jgi:hypothetical protein
LVVQNYEQSARFYDTNAEDNTIVGALFIAGAALMIGGAVAWHVFTRPSKPKAAATGPYLLQF